MPKTFPSIASSPLGWLATFPLRIVVVCVLSLFFLLVAMPIGLFADLDND